MDTCPFGGSSSVAVTSGFYESTHLTKQESELTVRALVDFRTRTRIKGGHDVEQSVEVLCGIRGTYKLVTVGR